MFIPLICELIGIKSISSPQDECFNTVINSIMLHTQDAFCTLYKVTFLNEIISQDKRLNILKGCFSFKFPARLQDFGLNPSPVIPQRS